MMLFIVCAALMTFAALAFVLAPLLRNQRAASPVAERLRALDAARDAGIVDADEYARKRAALESDSMPAQTPRASASAAIVLTAFLVPAVALTLYRLVGTPQAIDALSYGGRHAVSMDIPVSPDMTQESPLLAFI